MREFAVGDDVGEFARRQVGIDAGVIQSGALAGAAGFEVAAVVLHEDGIVVEPLQAAIAKQMRQPIAARFQFGVGHGLAGTRHDEGGLQRTKMSVLAGIHRALQVSFMRPEQGSRGPAPGRRSGADCAGSMALPSPAAAIRSKCSGPTWTSCRLRGRPRPRMKCVEHIAGVLARLSHRRGDQRLAFGVGRLVPAHHRRQHHAGGIAVRHVERGAEHIADAVACAHRHARGQRPHREPGADLAIHPRVEIVGVGFHARQRLASASTGPSAPARRHKDAPRASTGLRHNGRPRGCRSKATAIAACARSSAGSRITARGIASSWRSISLTLVRWLVTPAQRAELAAGDGRGNADLAHRRRCHRRHHALARPDRCRCRRRCERRWRGKSAPPWRRR